MMNPPARVMKWPFVLLQAIAPGAVMNFREFLAQRRASASVHPGTAHHGMEAVGAGQPATVQVVGNLVVEAALILQFRVRLGEEIGQASGKRILWRLLSLFSEPTLRVV